MANIHDIARLANCSVTTVSRVLNNHPYVSEEKRTQILSIIEELDYIPNAQARDLSKGASKNIGVLIPYANVPYYDKLISGIVKAAFQQDYKITLLPTQYNREKEVQYLQQLAAKAFDGLIIASKTVSFETIHHYSKYGPIICCEDTGAFPLSCVSFERERSYIDVFSYLKQKGKTSVGLAIGREEAISPSTKIVLSAYQKVFGVRPCEELLFKNCTDYAGGLAAGRYFSTFPPLAAVFANSDEVAAGIIQTLTSRAVEVIGEENLLPSQLLGFSTVDHHLDKCGEEAFQLLFAQQNTRTVIPYSFIKRQSKSS